MNHLRIGDNSVAMYTDSGELVAEAKDVIPSHNLLEVDPKFRGRGIATEVLDILEGYTGEKQAERAVRTSAVLFYLNRGFVPHKKILTDQKECFIKEDIETEDFTEEDINQIRTLLKQSQKDKEERILPFSITLRRDPKEAEVYKMLLERNFKPIAA